MTERYQDWSTSFKVAMNALKEVKLTDHVKSRIFVEEFPGKNSVTISVRVSDSNRTPNTQLVVDRQIHVPKPIGVRLTVNKKVSLIGYLLQIGVYDLLNHAEWGVVFNTSRSSIWYYKKLYEESL